MKIKERLSHFKQRLQPIVDVLKNKHRFVVMDMQTYKEKFSFQLTAINLFVVVGLLVVVFIVLTTVLIAFTPLREYIPGYSNADMVEQTIHNAAVIDSLEHEIAKQSWMITTIQDLMLERDMPDVATAKSYSDSLASLGVTITEYRRSKADSLLRIEVSKEDNSDPAQPPPDPVNPFQYLLLEPIPTHTP